MPPAYPSRSRTARKDAGIETRPLASILFVNVETKRSIPRFRTSPSTRTSQRAPQRFARGTQRFEPTPEPVGPWRSLWSGPSLQTGASPRTSLPGAVGHLWDAMEFYGRQWFINDFPWVKADQRRRSAHRQRKRPGGAGPFLAIATWSGAKPPGLFLEGRRGLIVVGGGRRRTAGRRSFVRRRAR